MPSAVVTSFQTGLGGFEVVVLLASVFLGGVFCVAAVAKLGDRGGVRRSLAGFGVPGRAVVPLGWTLVGCEVGVGVALLVGPAARAGAVGALSLLVGFSCAVGWNVGRGRRPSCRCFGGLSSAPVGWSTVARNGLLAAMAGFVAADGRFPLVFAGVGVVAAVVWVGPGLRLFWRLRTGAVAPRFSLSDGLGRVWTPEGLLARGTPLLLVFTDPGCAACRELMPEVARWQDALDSRLTVALVSGGSHEGQPAGGNAHGLRRLLIDADKSVHVRYGVGAIPSAILIDGKGTIAAAPAVGSTGIAGLVARALEPEEARFGRRALLRGAAAGVASAALVSLVVPAAAAARAVQRASRPKALKIDGAWLCDQRYALCTSAPCVPSESDPEIGVCTCLVKRGYSIGFKSCKRRAPRGDQLHSNFSLQNVDTHTRVMTCAARGIWTQCLDVVCHVDPDDPKRALCRCVKMKTKNYLTFGGNCDTTTCASTIWSATTAPFPGGAQYEKGLKMLGLPFRKPKSCPSTSRSS